MLTSSFNILNAPFETIRGKNKTNIRLAKVLMYNYWLIDFLSSSISALLFLYIYVFRSKTATLLVQSQNNAFSTLTNKDIHGSA